MAEQPQLEKLAKIATWMRYHILTMTTQAGSGHPTSALSGVELMAGLFFGGFFRYDLHNPKAPNNDRLIFSKGHATPLFYTLWAAAGGFPAEELKTYRHFGSRLEGHPAMTFPFTEAATGSLGQGLSIGVGQALNAKYLDKLPYMTYVLLGDSEMAEGSQWEALQLAAHYKLDNLVAVLDVNRLGQRGETMYGWDLMAYEDRVASFGWETILISDGHSFPEVLEAYRQAILVADKPVMIIAKTVKGKGVSFIENQNGWHGKPLDQEQLAKALPELGPVDQAVRGVLSKPEDLKLPELRPQPAAPLSYPPDKPLATRKAYGNALKRLYPEFPRIVSLDGEVSNSTYAEILKEAHPDRFFEMYIAEQNMVGAALGFQARGQLPFVSTFAAFFSRAYDQIRMSQYSDANLKFCGSHAGVSIGEDGPSQMGLEDLAMFRAILGSVVLYPCDAVSTERLVEAMARHIGISYLRTTRLATPILYGPDEKFPIGGCKVLRRSAQDAVTVVGAGITLFEALKAHEELLKAGLSIRVIDLYSVKPVDDKTLKEAAAATRAVITVEDHYPEGGLGDAVRAALAAVPTPVYSLAVRQKPKTGKPQELLDYEGISKDGIVKTVMDLMQEFKLAGK